MKKLLLFVIACLIFVVGATPVKKAYADNLSDSVILHLTANHGDGEIVINVNLFKNTGVTDMVLELSYDKEAFTFVEYIRGQALGTFNLDVTDYSSSPDLPIRFYWSKSDKAVGNDMSKGLLVQLKFKLSGGAKSGEYEIGFKSSGDDKLGVGYLDGNETKTKRAIIDKAVITVEGSKVGEVEIKEEELGEKEEKGTDVLLIVGISVFAVATLTAIAILIIKIRNSKRRRENWLKL